LDKDGKEMKREICKRTRKLIDVYYQNLPEAGPASQVEAHLSECPSCRKAYEETREVLILLKKNCLPDPEPGFWNGLSSRIMTQVRLNQQEEKEDPWYKKVWISPFGWPGYVWATALLLMLLTPVAIYNIHDLGNKTPSIQETKGPEVKWETGSLTLSGAVESLSDNESVRLAKRVMARMGKDLSGPTRLVMDDELHWDVSPSLEGLNNRELEILIKRMKPGDSAGYKEEREYVC
jgi:hypothetical protein